MSRKLTCGAVAALSGCAALIFENLWFRSAALSLGSGAWSSALVLAAFMAGLAVGNYLTLRFESRIVRPFRTCGVVELAIGLAGVLALVLLHQLTTLLGPAFRAIDAPWAVNTLRVLTAFVVLSIPAAGMGATLPVLMRALAVDRDGFARSLGFMYGANTGGAVAGALIAEFLLLPPFGVYGTGVIALLLNVIASALAFRLEGRGLSVSRSPRRTPPVLKTRPVWPLLAAAWASGALFLGFEAVFFRFQLLFFTSLATTFAVMLAIVLAGIALGGVAGGWWFSRSRDGDATLPTVFLGTSLILLLSYRFFVYTAEPAVTMSPVGGALATTAALALPVALMSGVAFTLLAHRAHASGYSEIRATAVVTIANTIGGAVGSIVAGFTLISALGLETCFRLLMLGYATVGVCLLGTTLARARRAPLVFAAVSLTSCLFAFPSGIMATVYQQFPVYTLIQAGEQRVAFREGQLETIQYLRRDLLGQPDYYRLVVNNHSMSASEARGRRYMRLFAYLPRLLHPHPRTAALLGLGLGVTAKGLTDDERLQAIDVVDISRDIPAMIDVVYPGPGESPLVDPRVRLHREDGRFFLQTSKKRYDIITGEPPPPHHSGVAALYSREFFRSVDARLNPGGIVTYWLPVRDLTLHEAQSITRAFVDVFPDASLWAGAGLEWILMAAKPQVERVTALQLREGWDRTPFGRRLREIGLDSPETMAALFLADGVRLRTWASGAPALTDNFPRRISLGAARTDEDDSGFLGMLADRRAATNFASSATMAALWPDDVRRDADAGVFERQARVNTLLSLPLVTVRHLAAVFGDGPADPLLVKALFWRHAFDVDRAGELLRAQPQLDGDDVAEYRAAVEMMQGRFREATEWLGRVSAQRLPRVRVIQMYCASRR